MMFNLIFTFYIYFFQLQAKANYFWSLYQERAVLHNQMEKDFMI